MKSWHYEGYTTRDGGVICCDCAGDLTESQEQEREFFLPIFADSEWDYYPACDVCQQELDYVSLTRDGIEYEKQYHPELIN